MAGKRAWLGGKQEPYGLWFIIVINRNMADRRHHRSDRRERDGRDEDYGRQDRGKRRRESPHGRDKRRERSRSPIERPRY